MPPMTTVPPMTALATLTVLTTLTFTFAARHTGIEVSHVLTLRAYNSYDKKSAMSGHAGKC